MESSVPSVSERAFKSKPDYAPLLFPSKEEFLENEYQYLARCAKFVLSVYAYYRHLLNKECFTMVRFKDRLYPKIRRTVTISTMLHSLSSDFTVYAVPEGHKVAREHVEKLSFGFSFDEHALNANLSNGRRFVLSLHKYEINEFFRILDAVKALTQFLPPLPKGTDLIVENFDGNGDMMLLASLKGPHLARGALVVMFSSTRVDRLTEDKIEAEIRKYDKASFADNREFDFGDPAIPSPEPPTANADNDPSLLVPAAQGPLDETSHSRHLQTHPSTDAPHEVIHSPSVKSSSQGEEHVVVDCSPSGHDSADVADHFESPLIPSHPTPREHRTSTPQDTTRTSTPQDTTSRSDVIDSDVDFRISAAVIADPVSTPVVHEGHSIRSSEVPNPPATVPKPSKRLSIPIRRIPSKSDVALNKIAKHLDDLHLDDDMSTDSPQTWAVEIHPMGFPIFTTKPIASKQKQNPFAITQQNDIQFPQAAQRLLKRGASILDSACHRDVPLLREDDEMGSVIKRPRVEQFAPPMDQWAHNTYLSPGAGSTPAVSETSLVSVNEHEESTSA
uniref:HORMA domain-containing protein n=1 Tax=Panagrellus redivivus TaxID=6233 RepID=A0A7E4ZX19_PANRE